MRPLQVVAPLVHPTVKDRMVFLKYMRLKRDHFSMRLNRYEMLWGRLGLQWVAGEGSAPVSLEKRRINSCVVVFSKGWGIRERISKV